MKHDDAGFAARHSLRRGNGVVEVADFVHQSNLLRPGRCKHSAVKDVLSGQGSDLPSRSDAADQPLVQVVGDRLQDTLLLFHVIEFWITNLAFGKVVGNIDERRP